MSTKMPVLFVGHGSPMIALEENNFTRGFLQVTAEIPKPDVIICISAHWETEGTFVTGMETPRTIHDFVGFPRELYEVQYPAPGNPELAGEIIDTLRQYSVGPDYQWGLDHGTWTVLKHMYPDADIPVVQLSLDRSKTPQEHYSLARCLSDFRNRGILIMGSGNMVHNLHLLDWGRINDDDYGFGWAISAAEKMYGYITANNHAPLIDYFTQGEDFRLSIPTPEHYLPMLYALALQTDNEKVEFFNRGFVGGSLVMTALKIG